MAQCLIYTRDSSHFKGALAGGKSRGATYIFAGEGNLSCPTRHKDLQRRCNENYSGLLSALVDPSPCVIIDQRIDEEAPWPLVQRLKGFEGALAAAQASVDTRVVGL